MHLIRFAYLAAILASSSGVALAGRRFGVALAGHRLLRSVAVTVPVFLSVDAVGVARGWFRSNPALNIAIIPPGISLEEPLLLSFLVLLSVVVWRVAGRWA